MTGWILTLALVQTLDINGPYASLESSFIVAELLPNKEKTLVTVHGFRVPLSLKS